MPAIEVFNGDLEDALEEFKSKVAKEGIISKYKHRQCFLSSHEIRAMNAHKREQRKRRRQTL